MVTYQYSISMVKVVPAVDGLQNVVYLVEWIVDAENGGLRSRYVNSSLVGNPDPNNFIAFENLTESIVKSWLPDPLTPEMQRTLTDDLARQASELQAVYQPLPWSA